MKLLKLLPLPLVVLFSSCEKKSDPSAVESTKSSERAETIVKSDSTSEKEEELDPEEEKKAALEERVKAMSFAEINELLQNPTEEQKKELNDPDFVSALFKHLGEIAPEEGTKLISLLHFSRQNTATNALFSAWGEADFESAIATAEALEKRSQQKNAVLSSLLGLAEKDPSLAYDLVAKYDAKSARFQIMINWLETDPLAAFTKIRDYDSQNMKNIMQENMGMFLAKMNPEKLTDVFNSLSNKEERLSFLKGVSGVSEAKAREHLTSLFNSLSDQEELVYAEEFQTVSKAIANPEKIANEFLSSDIENASLSLIKATMSSWAKTDINAALDFIEKLPAHAKRDSALGEALRTWAKNSPESALNYALNLPNESKNAVNHLGFSLDVENPVNMSDILFNADPSLMSKKITGDFFGRWTSTDFHAAVSHVSTLPQDHPNTPAAYAGVANAFGNHPEEALPWIETIPEGEALNQVSEKIAQKWSYNDVEATLDWVNTLPDSEQRNHAVSGLSPVLAVKDPMLAAEWSDSINDEGMRKDAMETVYKSWSYKDKAAATEWLNTSELFTPEQRERLGK